MALLPPATCHLERRRHKHDLAAIESTLRADMSAGFAELRGEIHAGFAELRTELATAITNQTKWLTTVLAAWSALLLTAVRLLP